MTQTAAQIDDENSIILTGIFCGVGVVFVIVFLVFQCVCCKKQTSRSNGLVKESSRKRVQLQAVASANNQNGIYETEYVNETCFNNPARPSPGAPILINGKGYRFVQNGAGSSNRVGCSLHRALPAPPTPSTGGVAAPSSYGNGTLTRESSTSELYASVDKQQQGRRGSVDVVDSGDNQRLELPSLNTDNHRNSRQCYQSPVHQSSLSTDPSRCHSHLYAKICDDHVYSKIWYPANQEATIDTYDNLTAADDSDFDPFYSRVNEDAAASSANFNALAGQQQRPSHQQRPPFKRILAPHQHAYEYPHFAPKQSVLNSVSPKTSSVSTDPFYSKVGSEDPYSSIRSEEHYSRVDREDSLSVDGDSTDTRAQPSTVRQNTNDFDDGGYYAAPGLSSGIRRPTPVYRRRSDGDEYAMVRKGSSGLYNTPVRRQPPPIPRKRFGEDQQVAPTVDDVTDTVNDDLSAVPSAAAAAAVAVGNSNKEPSYRYITVRESLDALRERMEQQRRPATSSATAVYAAISDPSLHYYSTISEHSYEVVPSMANGRTSRQPANSTFDDTAYIDQDEMDVCSSRADVTLTPDLNTTFHSDESSTVRGSHVTLVQVDAVLANSIKSTSGETLEIMRPSSVPPSAPPPLLLRKSPPNHDVTNAISCIPKSIDNQRRPTTSSRLLPSQLIPNGTVTAGPLLSTQQACAVRNTRSTSDSEYPTTLCFCHAPKSGSKKLSPNNKSTVKKRSPDDKRDSRF